MAIAPAFANTPRIGIGQISVANTNRDGTGSVVTVLAGGANGTLIRVVRIQATATTTAGIVRLYIYDGVNTRLVRELRIDAKTPSGTVEAYFTQLVFIGDDLLILPSASHELRASTHNAEAFNVIAIGADF